MSLRKEMVNGVFWTAIQKYSGLFFQLVITGVLARLLTPEDFGIVAIATIVIAFFNLFTDMGVGAAIIQNQNLTKNDINQIFSFTIVIGIVLAFIFAILSYPIGHFYKNDILITICQLLSFNLLFASFNIVPNALIHKNKRFKYAAKVTLTVQAICGVVSIVSAFYGLGLYSLLISPIFSTMSIFIIYYRQYKLNFFQGFTKQCLNKIFSYSAYQFLFNFINYFSRNLDKLIIGKFYSMQDLGYYEKSYRLMLLPLNNITNVVTPVMHPILTSLQNDFNALADKYNKIIRFIALISFPMGAYLYFAGSDIIYIVFGNNWEQAVPVFKILSLSLPLQMVLSTIGAIYQASGKTKFLFYGGLCNSTCTIIGFILTALFYDQIEAIAWAWNITLLINTINSYFILYKLVLKASVTPLLKSCIYPFISSIILTIILMLYTRLVQFESNILDFSIMSIIALTHFLLFNAITKQIDLKSIFMLLSKKISH